MYNQTASKTEQIALARYITDGKLVAQIKKAKKLLENKTMMLKDAINSEFNPHKIKVSDSGFVVSFRINSDKTPENIEYLFLQKKVMVKTIKQIKQNELEIFVSSAGISENEIYKLVKIMKNTINCT